MFKNKDNLDKVLFKISMYTILTITIAYGLSRIVYYIPTIFKSLTNGISIAFGLLGPFICGLVIAYLVSPLSYWFNRVMFNNEIILKGKKLFKDEKSYKSSKMKLCLSIICSYIVVIGSIALLICITYCAIKDKVSNIEFSTAIDLTNEYMEKYQNKITEISESIKKLEVPDETKKNIISSLYQFSTAFANFGSGVVNFIKGISKNVANIFIGLIIAFYIILDAEFFKEVWNNILLLIFKKKFRLKISTTFKEIDEVLSNFVRGQLLDCLIVAVVSILVLLSIKIEFAVVLGIFAGIANVIPYFGPIIGMIPAVIVALLSGEPLKALFAIIGLLIVQQIDGNILAPRIIGGTVGIHPVFVIIGIIIGAYYMGIIGMIIAVPICGMIKILLNKLIKYKKSLEEKNGTN